MSKVSSKDGIIATNVYSYDEQNRLTETVATTTGSSAEVHTYFGYDNNGNQISKWVQSVGVSDGENLVALGELGVNAADDMALYSYDNFNRLTGILQGNTTIQNAYNGRGRKISRTTDGETRYYVYDGNTVIAELDGQNELKARNVYGRNLISRTTDKPMIMSYNGHGDIVLVRSVSGETLAEYAYDEFGNPLSDGISLQFTIEPVEGAEEKTDYSQEIDNPYRYAGYEYLDSVDLYDLNARYYNPKTARFLSEDPYFNLGNRVIGLYEINVPSVLSIMQANALYVYCGNNPTTYSDYTGNMATEAATVATNWWNPIGWVAGSVLVAEVVVVVAIAIDKSSRTYSATDDEYEKARDNGEVAPNSGKVRQGEGENKSLPATGDPNSSTDLEEPDGTLKQRRYYGPDGKAQEDIDYKHSGDKHKFPHRHIWRWNGDKTERIPK